MTFKPGMTYHVKHVPSGEEWHILGVSHNKQNACAAGYPPSIGKVADMTEWVEAGEISQKDKEYRNKQFSLFGFQKPVGKVTISAARIQEAKDAIAKKDVLGSVQALRDIRYKLEAFEKRIGQKKAP